MDNDFVTNAGHDRLEGDMDKDLAPFASALQRVRLTHAEKDRMLTAILEQPAAHAFAWQVFASLRRAGALSLVAVLLMGSGAAYAAEGALPGDFLYPVKVNVTEPIRGRFARSARARAEWKSMLAQRRLEESETLAAEGRLTDEWHRDLVALFQEHADDVSSEIEAMLEGAEVAQAAELSADFEASLNAHASMLDRISHARKSRRTLVTDLMETVRKRTTLIGHVRERAHNRVRMIASAETGLKGPTESAIAIAGRRLNEARSALAQRQQAPFAEEAAIKLTAVEDGLADARLGMDAGAVEDALDEANAALSMAQEVSLFLKHTDLAMEEDAAAGASATMMMKAMPQAEEPSDARFQPGFKRIESLRKLFDITKPKLTEAQQKAIERELTLAEEALARGDEQESAVHVKKARKLLLRPQASVETETETGSEENEAQEGGPSDAPPILEIAPLP